MRLARRDGAQSNACEAAIINTGGGMAGGDCLSIRVETGAFANVILATPAAERVYRSTGPDTGIEVALRLQAQARLAWLPQETILFRGARLARRLEVDMDESATLVIAETTIFGRLAMGETPGHGLFADRWRIRRGGRLAACRRHCASTEASRAFWRGRPSAKARAPWQRCSSCRHRRRTGSTRRGARLSDADCECGASAWNGMLARALPCGAADASAPRLGAVLACSDATGSCRAFGPAATSSNRR